MALEYVCDGLLFWAIRSQTVSCSPVACSVVKPALLRSGCRGMTLHPRMGTAKGPGVSGGERV
jgi:hypothetical protein